MLHIKCGENWYLPEKADQQAFADFFYLSMAQAILMFIGSRSENYGFNLIMEIQ